MRQANKKMHIVLCTIGLVAAGILGMGNISRAEDGNIPAGYTAVLQAGEILVNKENFPDQVLREAVQGESEEKEVSIQNAATGQSSIITACVVNTGLKELSVEDKTVKNLKGLELLPNLEKLWIHNYKHSKDNETVLNTLQQLKSLSVSGKGGISSMTLKLPKLQELTMEYVDFSALNIRGCTSLKRFQIIHDSKLAKLDLSKNRNLTDIICAYNKKLAKLVLPDSRKLQSLTCSHSAIAKLNVKKYTKLWSLECNDTKLKSLDVTQNTKLKFLNCSNTRISRLNLKKNKKLCSLVITPSKTKKVTYPSALCSSFVLFLDLKKGESVSLKRYIPSGYVYSSSESVLDQQEGAYAVYSAKFTKRKKNISSTLMFKKGKKRFMVLFGPGQGTVS